MSLSPAAQSWERYPTRLRKPVHEPMGNIESVPGSELALWRNVPVIWVVFLTKVRGQEERCGGVTRSNLADGADEAGVHSQSMNPFHADTDALRAVSTVPPMTTSFCACGVC